MSVLSAEQNLRLVSSIIWKIMVTMLLAPLPSLATNAGKSSLCADSSIGMEKLRSCKMTSIFCLFCLLTNASTYGIIRVWFNGPWTDVRARISARLTPYEIFLLLLATLIWPPIFPKTRRPAGPIGNPNHMFHYLIFVKKFDIIIIQ